MSLPCCNKHTQFTSQWSLCRASKGNLTLQLFLSILDENNFITKQTQRKSCKQSKFSFDGVYKA